MYPLKRTPTIRTDLQDRCLAPFSGPTGRLLALKHQWNPLIPGIEDLSYYFMLGIALRYREPL